MRILVTGPESAGTKLTAHLLKCSGAQVVHHTPRHAIGDAFENGSDFDAVVLVVRNSFANAHSIVQNGHAYDLDTTDDDSSEAEQLHLAYRMVPEALLFILLHLHSLDNVYILTYEALVHDQGAIRALCANLGLTFPKPRCGSQEVCPHEHTYKCKCESCMQAWCFEVAIGNANAKHYDPFNKSVYFRDSRPLEER